MLLLHGAHPDWSAKVEQVSVCGQSGSELPQQPGHMTPRTSFRKHILLNLSHNIYYKLYLKSSWQCNLCDECLPFLWYNEYLMPPGSLCEVTSEITLKGRSKIVVCYQIVLSKRAWSRHIFFSGVTSWKNKRLEEPSFHIFFFFYQQTYLFTLWKMYLFILSRDIWGNYLQFFFIIVKFSPNSWEGLIGIQTLYLYKYHFLLHARWTNALLRLRPQEE